MLDEAWAELPGEFFIREFSAKGITYVTTLLDAKAHPKNLWLIFTSSAGKLRLISES